MTSLLTTSLSRVAAVAELTDTETLKGRPVPSGSMFVGFCLACFLLRLCLLRGTWQFAKVILRFVGFGRVLIVIAVLSFYFKQEFGVPAGGDAGGIIPLEVDGRGARVLRAKVFHRFGFGCNSII